jgi:hypothetical protein
MTDSNTILYENQSYQVIFNDDLDGYVLLNRETGVYELAEDYLPDAIYAAISGHARLEWYAKIAEEIEAQEDLEDLQIEVELDDRTIN